MLVLLVLIQVYITLIHLQHTVLHTAHTDSNAHDYAMPNTAITGKQY